MQESIGRDAKSVAVAPPRTGTRWVWWLVAIAVIAGAVVGWRRLYGPVTSAAAPVQDGRRFVRQAGPGVAVVVAPARQQDLPVYLDGIGSAQAFNTVTVKTRIDGQLTEVDFTEGQDVKKGDLLAKIDARPYEVALNQAQAVFQKDQSQLEDVRRNAVRDKQLVAQGVIPQQQADTQDSLLGQLQAAVLADQSQIDNAKLQIFYCQITAPIGGRVGLRAVDAGNMVHASDPGGLVTITQVQPIAVLFSLPEDNLPAVVARMRAGSTLSVRAMSRDSGTQLASGTLLTIDNQIDPTTGTFRLKAVFDNQERNLWPSQFVNARLLLDTQRNATVIPAAAVQTGSKGAFVYALKPDNTVEIRPVKVGIAQADIVSVDGVSPGDEIVTDGQDRLQAGTRVDAQSDARGTDPAAAARPDAQKQKQPKQGSADSSQAKGNSQPQGYQKGDRGNRQNGGQAGGQGFRAGGTGNPPQGAQ